MKLRINVKGGIRRLKFYLDPVITIQILIPISIFLLFFIIPLGVVVFSPILYAEAGAYSPIDVFKDPKFISFKPVGSPIIIRDLHIDNRTITRITVLGASYGIILNSLINASIVTVGATFLGVIVAFILARYNFPGRTILRILATVPLLITPFINAYVVRKIFSYNGLISWFISDILDLPYQIHIDKLAGVAIAQIMTFYPIVYLNVFASICNIDPSLEEQAENLGAKGFRLFRTVTLPLSLPGLAAGAAIVFIFSLEDLGAPIAFRERRLMSMYIFEGIRAAYAGEILPGTATLALILLMIALAVFIGIKKYVSLKQYAMLSRGGRWRPRLRRPGIKGLMVIYLVIFPLVAFTALPQIGVFVFTFSEKWAGPLPEGFTLKYITEIVANPDVSRAVVNSLTYSFIALLLIVLTGVSASYVVSRARIFGVELLDVLITSPIAIPGLAIAAGYFMFFTKFFKYTSLDPFTTGPAILLILAYSIRRLPFTARAVFAGLQQVHVALEEASLNLGAGRFKTLRSIVLPLIGLNVLSGALVSFVYCMSETSVSVTLGGIEPSQAPITYMMYEYMWGGKVWGPHLVAALGVLLITIQLIVIIIVNLVLKQRYAYIGV